MTVPLLTAAMQELGVVLCPPAERISTETFRLEGQAEQSLKVVHSRRALDKLAKVCEQIFSW